LRDVFFFFPEGGRNMAGYMGGNNLHVHYYQSPFSNVHLLQEADTILYFYFQKKKTVFFFFFVSCLFSEFSLFVHAEIPSWMVGMLELSWYFHASKRQLSSFLQCKPKEDSIAPVAGIGRR